MRPGTCPGSLGRRAPDLSGGGETGGVAEPRSPRLGRRNGPFPLPTRCPVKTRLDGLVTVSLDEIDRYYLREFIYDDREPTDIRVECLAPDLWTATVGTIELEASSPAALLEGIAAILKEA